jgi:hypothetical protein
MLKLIHYLVLLTLLSACVSPDPASQLSPEDQDLYITNRDVSVNFANYRTYAIVDTVKVITKNTSDTLGHKSNFSAQIISTINFQMLKDGFVQVSRSQNPDVGLNVNVLKFSEQVPSNYFAYANPGNGYYGYPNTNFWGYPSYQYGIPTYYGYFQISIGSVSIEMIDLKNAKANPANTKLNVIWTALIAGSIADTTMVNTTRIKNGINASFNQSPYLKDGK